MVVKPIITSTLLVRPRSGITKLLNPPMSKNWYRPCARKNRSLQSKCERCSPAIPEFHGELTSPALQQPEAHIKSWKTFMMMGRWNETNVRTVGIRTTDVKDRSYKRNEKIASFFRYFAVTLCKIFALLRRHSGFHKGCSCSEIAIKII